MLDYVAYQERRLFSNLQLSPTRRAFDIKYKLENYSCMMFSKHTEEAKKRMQHKHPRYEVCQPNPQDTLVAQVLVDGACKNNQGVIGEFIWIQNEVFLS